MSKSKQRSQADSEQRTVGNRGNDAMTPSTPRRSARRDQHSDFSDFGRDGGDNDLGFVTDIFRRSPDE